MAEPAVVARSPMAPSAPVQVVEGWEVAVRRSGSDLTLVDCAPLTKVLVIAAAGGSAAEWLGVTFGLAARTRNGALVIGSAPDEWMVYAAPGASARVLASLEAQGHDELVTAFDATHGRALVRLTGNRSAELLSKLCALDLGELTTPNATASRGSVAAVTTDVVRDDHDGTRSYLLACERSFGRYLLGALLDAGAEFGIEEQGFAPPGI